MKPKSPAGEEMTEVLCGENFINSPPIYTHSYLHLPFHSFLPFIIHPYIHFIPLRNRPVYILLFLRPSLLFIFLFFSSFSLSCPYRVVLVSAVFAFNLSLLVPSAPSCLPEPVTPDWFFRVSRPRESYCSIGCCVDQ